MKLGDVMSLAEFLADVRLEKAKKHMVVLDESQLFLPL
jgi:hypothetical protein